MVIDLSIGNYPHLQDHDLRHLRIQAWRISYTPSGHRSEHYAEFWHLIIPAKHTLAERIAALRHR